MRQERRQYIDKNGRTDVAAAAPHPCKSRGVAVEQLEPVATVEHEQGQVREHKGSQVHTERAVH
jgi:hypothetical protein